MSLGSKSRTTSMKSTRPRQSQVLLFLVFGGSLRVGSHHCWTAHGMWVDPTERWVESTQVSFEQGLHWEGEGAWGGNSACRQRGVGR